ncbi:MAG: Autotransporter adhesin [Labilithrix sp.]|nr:Autotransporter adhesin [Labilithrix sp.]
MDRRRLLRCCALAVASVSASAAACSSFSGGDAPDPADAGPAAASEAAPTDSAPADAARADAANGSAYRALVMADGPIAYWRMGVKAGIVIPDETPGKNDLVLQGPGGAYELGVAGAIPGDDDTAVRFDGRDGYARVTDAGALYFPSSHAFSIELWAKRDVLDGGHTFQMLVSNTQGVAMNRTGFSMYATPYPNGGISTVTSFEYDAYDGGDVSTTAKLVPAGEWGHYVGVFDADKNVTLYVNATPGVSRLVKGPLTLSSATLLVAATAEGGEFPGAIDEVAIYDKALTLTQIAAHRTAGLP